MEITEDNMKTNEQLNKIDEQKELTTADLNEYKRKLAFELNQQKKALDLELQLLRYKLEDDKKVAYQKVTEAQNQTTVATTGAAIKRENRQAEFDRHEELLDQQLTKESQTPKIRKYNLISEAQNNLSGKYMEAVDTIF